MFASARWGEGHTFVLKPSALSLFPKIHIWNTFVALKKCQRANPLALPLPFIVYCKLFVFQFFTGLTIIHSFHSATLYSPDPTKRQLLIVTKRQLLIMIIDKRCWGICSLDTAIEYIICFKRLLTGDKLQRWPSFHCLPTGHRIGTSGEVFLSIQPRGILGLQPPIESKNLSETIQTNTHSRIALPMSDCVG